jgi:transglutaminase-like putative cysteine protease
MQRIFTDFKFVSGFSNITTPIEEIFEAKKGVCQDFAQFAIGALKSLGIPARYVSGYIQTNPEEGKEKLFGADASHAWFSVYIPTFGWADFDPTNNKVPNEEYIILGYGRDYLDISPLKGVVQSSGNSILGVKVNVKRLDS